MSMRRHFQRILILALVIPPKFSQSKNRGPVDPTTDLVAWDAGILDRGPGRGAARKLE